jgi:pilus biogenesis lipoprotein CpaD
MRGTIQKFTVLASVALLTACNFQLNQHVMEAKTSYEYRQGNRVDMVQYSHDVNFSGGKSIPTDPEFDRLDAFVQSIQMGYGDQITLRGSAPERREVLAAYIQRLGLPVSVKTIPGGKAEVAANKVSVQVERHVVTPPSCPNWSNFHGKEERNTPGSNYGCAVDASLGYTIANPRDLVEGQAPGPALGKPVIEAQRRYQAGRVTPPTATGTGG